MFWKLIVTAFLIASCFCIAVSAQISNLGEHRQILPSPISRTEANIINTLHALHEAQYAYLMTVGNGAFGTFTHLKQAGLIDAELATGTKYNYLFTIRTQDSSAHSPATYAVTAVPQLYMRTGRRSFYMDESGLIRGVDNQGLYATVNDPLLLNAEQCSPFANCYNAAIQSLQALYNAQTTYRATSGSGNFGTLQQLFQAGLIDAALAAGRKHGFSYSMLKRNQSNQCSATFSLVIVPQSLQIDLRSLYVDETGIIRQSPNGAAKPADQDDAPLDL